MAAASPTGATGRACGVPGVQLATDPHVRLLGGPKRVVHAVTPGPVEAHPVRGIGRQELRLGATEQAGYILGPRRVAAQEAVIPELPEIASFRPGCPPRFLERIVEVEALHLLALLADLDWSGADP